MRLNSKGFIALLVVSLYVMVSAVEAAGTFGDLKAKMIDARNSLTLMIQHPDMRGAEQQKKIKETADAVSATLAQIRVPDAKASRYKLLVDTWDAFKKTREEVLVPLILSGKEEEAISIASGVQGDRFLKMIALIDEISY
ncbi:MAG TPA: hypothetical protein DDW94_09735 [Deltaproteobacteria bacterium]|nr:MAG: hypothetical protein A2Z79_12335 [Deltaproteobacteria bacterium GWA2_55_82]OGQ63958.1 MAG: hypothetical protein A3I81_07865 [Deltaproteobacteria bacterium RIFCSPLOWO2_02_FULL_55_12]OIJ73391.1 MAG: hypothetical protein A2V21_303405 [Deltaproteobacteria bacterium GWC2_55_46]HBG47252.1 hypothetical protein [Deltaproteobacteria bacterium]HCY10018.1 hypothetical protein [Deltaproteobacteria bacterium]